MNGLGMLHVAIMDSTSSRHSCDDDFLSTLPREVLFDKVFDFLSIGALLKLRRLCRALFVTVHDYFQLCRQLNFTHMHMTAGVFDMITYENDSMQILKLSKSYSWLTMDMLNSLILRQTNLKMVDLSYCTQLSGWTTCILATQSFQTLSHISLCGCHWLDQDNFKIFTGSCVNIKALNISSCWNLNDECLVFAARSCRMLTILSVCNIYTITDVTMAALASNCQQLEKLDIRGCWRITGTGVQYVDENCDKFSQLLVAGCAQLQVGMFASIG